MVLRTRVLLDYSTISNFHGHSHQSAIQLQCYSWLCLPPVTSSESNESKIPYYFILKDRYLLILACKSYLTTNISLRRPCVDKVAIFDFPHDTYHVEYDAREVSLLSWLCRYSLQALSGLSSCHYTTANWALKR